jgi:uncharacterized membrane protein
MLVLAAVGLILAMIFTALAVDIGFLAADKRTDQKIADLAALDASRDLAGVSALCGGGAPISNPASTCPAVVSAKRNNFTPDAKNTLLAELVTKTAAGTYVPSVGGKFVRVTINSPRKPFFPFVGTDERTVTAKAVAGAEPEAEFSVGSTLASLDAQKSFLDPLLGSMLGSSVSPLNMNAVSYTGLASGNVGLRALQTNLLAMGYDVGTTDKLLNTSVRAADLLRATAQALGSKSPPDTVAAAEINDIPLALIPNLKTVALGKLISVSQPSNDSALDATLNAFDIVSGAAQVANGTNFVNVPGIAVTIPGGLLGPLGSITTSLSVIEPAQKAKGPILVTKAKTSQVKLRLHVDLLQKGALALLAPVALDIDFSAASAEGTLQTINCGAPPGITISATTSGAAVGGTATVLGALGGTLDLSGTLAGTVAGPPLAYAYPGEFVPPVGPGPFSRHVGAASLVISPANITVTPVSGALVGAVKPVLDILMPTILSTYDSLASPLLSPVLKALGLDLAGADVSAIQIYEPPPSCGLPTLVE